MCTKLFLKPPFFMLYTSVCILLYICIQLTNINIQKEWVRTFGDMIWKIKDFLYIFSPLILCIQQFFSTDKRPLPIHITNFFVSMKRKTVYFLAIGLDLFVTNISVFYFSFINTDSAYIQIWANEHTILYIM